MTARVQGRRGAGFGVLGTLLFLLTPVARAQDPEPALVLPRTELVATGRSRLSEALQALLPALNLPHPAVAAGSEHARPWTLFGMGVDQVLVLVDGRPRQRSALLHTAGIVGRGQSGVELDAIPLQAIERVELYRPGAAARFGTGAVAGVLNLVLRTRGASELLASSGLSTAGDGEFFVAEGSHTLPLGSGGLVRGTLELAHYGATNRALPDRRSQYFPNDPRNGDPALNDRVNHRFGEPHTGSLAALLRAEKRIGDSLQVHGFAAWTRRTGSSGDFWRRASEDRTVRALFPNGFLPLLEPRREDAALHAGVRGRLWGWEWDASTGYDRSGFRYQLNNTANVSLGAQSPTEFHAGTLRADAWSAGVRLSRRLAPGWMPPVRLTLTGGHRTDGYQIEPGEPDSYRYGAVLIPDGPNAGRIPPIGVQGFPAFQPGDAGTVRRGMLAGSGLLGMELAGKLELWAAARVEDYPDFPVFGVYELAAAAFPLRGLSLRAALGTGARVPSLAESWYSSRTTRVIGGFGLDERTVPPGLPLAQLLGVPVLRPEHSRHRRIGASARPWNALELSVDAFRVEVEDRIILTGLFDAQPVREYLAGQGVFGIAGVRFFTNALRTRSSGVDLTARYRAMLGDKSLLLRGSYFHGTTRVLGVDTLSGPLAQYPETLFDRLERARLEHGQPADNLILAAELRWRAWELTLRAQSFGSVTSFGLATDGSLDQTYGAKSLFDLRAQRKLGDWELTLGVQNLLGTYPDRNRFGDATEPGNSNFGIFPYPEASPFGFTGRSVYLRARFVQPSSRPTP